MTAEPRQTGNLRRLRKRAQFLNAAKGSRAGRTGFSLQAIAVADETPGLGFTVTKKTGNSPERNRIKRRLRAAARACGATFQRQFDYVLIGRREALNQPFGKVIADLSSAISKVHAPRRDAQDRKEP
jgi:ribonuclease P protein component